MFITLYFIVTRLPDSLRSVRDHFLSLEPTSLTVDLLEQHLIAAETSAVAVGAARGTPRPPFFEGSSPSPLAPSYASATAADVPVAEDVGDASASAKHRSSKGKGGRGGGGGSGGDGGGSESGGGGSSGGGGGSGGGSGSGTGGGSGGSACDGPFLHCPPVSGRFVQLTVRFSPPLLLYELGEYRCPPGCDGHYHHSWGSACVDLLVHTDRASPGHVHSSAKVESVHTGYRASSGSSLYS
ncbi:unnamed protein product, partial [Closterium sp. NIES-54]